jgi:hypothetical protein
LRLEAGAGDHQGPEARLAGERLKRFIGLGLLAAGLGLTACQDGTVTQMTGSVPRVTAPGIPVAVETIEGAPDAIQAKVQEQVVTEASARRIDLVAGGADPRYRLRGYVSASSTDDGNTTLALVWDVYDASKRRAQRVSTSTIAKGQAGDPWSLIGPSQIAVAASDSMNEIAAFLAGTVSPGADGTPSSSSPSLAYSASE